MSAPHNGLSKLVGDRILALRTQRGLSQEALAERMGRQGVRIHQTQVSKIEAGRAYVIVEHVAAFATALAVPITELLSDTPEEVQPLPAADEEIAARLDAMADTYPEFAFPEDSTSAEGLAAAAMRLAYRTSAQIARGASPRPDTVGHDDTPTDRRAT